MTEERILDFLDGNLDSSEEEELLHRLAVSPERRNLLKQHLQMRDLTATLSRRQTVVVPKMLTASLFTALAANGYAGPLIPTELNQKESLVASLESDLNRSAKNIAASKSIFSVRRSVLALTSVLSFIVGGVLVFALMPGTDGHGVSYRTPTSSSIPNVAPGIVSSATSSFLQHQSPHVTNRVTQANSSSEFIPVIQVAGEYDENQGVEHSLVPTSNQPNNPIEARGDDGMANISMADLPSAASFAKSELADFVGSRPGPKNPFDMKDPIDETKRSFWQRLTVSLRAGEGKAPGNEQALSGSLIEIKASADIADWLVAKVSLGQFMPYETQAITAQPGVNSDGVPLLQLSPVLQYKYIIGAECGLKFGMFNAPFEFSAGFISDLQGTVVPRAGLFTSLPLQDDLSMNIGLEGMIYTHDIRSSIRTAQNGYSGGHPSLIGALKEKESTGFIGPAIEMVWHF
ncbi:MAG: hypothetical protein Q8916_01915 [Bacteroidota bacterium]|nr:hypothetical protein [Bacteroidota bacterium]MDP4235454.1 hypothetical protein [Bacteroidota bacterium]